MSWIIRLYDEQGDIKAEQSGYLYRADAVNAVPYMLQLHNVDGYDRDEYMLNLNNISCMDCMDTEKDVQYLLTVFEQGKPDPYDIMKREHERLVDEMRRMGLYYDSLEEFQRRKGDAGAQKDSGASCTCELIF